MASSAYVSLLLVLALVAAPQLQLSLSAILVTELGEIRVFDKSTLSITIDAGSMWFGEVIDAVEMEAQIQQLSFMGGKFKRYFLQLRNDRLIQLVFLGPDGISTKLLFRLLDLYLIGFANQKDHWFLMKGAEDIMHGSGVTATVLPFGVRYRDLLQGIAGSTIEQKLANLALGRTPILEAIRVLGTGDPSDLDPKVPPSLALFAVTVSESLRLYPIRKKVGRILSSYTIGYLDDDIYYGYIKNWARLSIFLVCSLHGRPLGYTRGYSELNRIKIFSEQEAIDVIAIMKRPSNYDPDDPEGSCDDGRH